MLSLKLRKMVMKMKKKLFSTLILVTLLASVLPSLPVMASPAVLQFDLIADGGSAATAVDVGDVLVWNDEEYLYVEYVTDGWYISEVHLEVKTALGNIPQKNGNPIPGKFTYGEKGLWTMDYEFDPIPLSWPADTQLYIAAHAKVWEAASLTSMSVVSAPGVSVYGPSSSYHPVGDFVWGTSNPAVATWVHTSWPSIPGATWISTAYDNEFPRPDSWRWFRDTFNVPGYPKSGNIVAATSDNAEEVYLNGVLVGSDGEVQGPFIDNQEWQTILNYPIAPQMGSNTLDFIVRNYAYGTDDPHVNPTGLIYKASVEYYAREETAWGAGTGFSGKNWATYFTYTVQGWVLLETLTVDSTSVTGTTSTTVLDSSKTYKFEASGTWTNTVNNVADAEYTSKDNWATHADGYIWPPYAYLGANFGDLQVGSTFINWGSYSASHVYDYEHAGTGTTVTFRVFDGEDPNPVPSWYGDNSGSLTVDIFIWQ